MEYELAEPNYYFNKLLIDGSSIPEWAVSFINVGIQICDVLANEPNDTHALELAISLPTRKYASAFINLGLQIGFYEKTITGFSAIDYFSILKRTPIEHELRYYENKILSGNSKKRIYKGIETDPSGKEWLLLQNKTDSSKVDKIASGRSYCVLQDGQAGVKNLKNIVRILSALGKNTNVENAVAFTFNTETLAAIVGHTNSLMEEHKFMLGHSEETSKFKLPLCDVTRLGDQTLILSSMRDESIEILESKSPPLVIYESISAVNKYRDAYAPKVRIYLLDRSKPTYRDYQKQIDEFHMCRAALTPPLIIDNLQGIETLSFYSY